MLCRVTIVVCVCVVCVCPVQFFPNSNESAKNMYGSPHRCNRLIYNYFFVKQPLHEDTEFEWQLYWCTCWPFCLPSQPPEHIIIHVMLFSTTFFYMGFVIVFGATLYSACAHLHHWTLTSTTCNCSPEGRNGPI